MVDDYSTTTNGGTKYCKTLYLIRHAEGIHNVAENTVGKVQWKDCEAKKDKYIDATLTNQGIIQATQLRQYIEKECSKIKFDCIITSPLTRAIQTANIGCSHYIGKLPFIASELVREITGIHKCDKRSSTTKLVGKYPHVNFTMTIASDDDPLWKKDVREPIDQIKQRALDFLKIVFTLESNNIIVVSHSQFIKCLLQLLDHPLMKQVPEYIVPHCQVIPVCVALTVSSK